MTGPLVKIDGKGISAVGQALIEKVADGIGGLYAPTQLVRLARAQAKADLITAQAAIEIDELKQRAMQRFVVEEAKRQSNIEEITRGAIPLLDEKAEPQKMDDDWVANFFDKSRIVSDSSMQNLWSKVLAGESNEPGRYARRTVNIIADLDKSDAELFSTLCRFRISLIVPWLVICDFNDDIYKSLGINFETLGHLASLGLIHFSDFSNYLLNGMPNPFGIKYFDKTLLFEKEEGAPVDIGRVKFTKAGLQLCGLTEGAPVDGFEEYLIDYYSGSGFKMTQYVELRAEGGTFFE